jgi:4-amino-4-deoxy-L-arabinose transferase-like glycosyltransferase
MRPITRDPETIFKILFGFTTIALVVSIVLLASVPPVSRDALTHHLAVPKLYLQHGKMVELPNVPFSYYPMNLDLLYILPLYFGNDIVPKFIHFLFALMTAGLLFGFLKKRLGTLYAMIGSLMFLSTPVIVKLSITVYVDLGLVFFSTAALIYLVKWSEADLSIRHLILSAVFCGLALGTKYNGLVTFFLMTIFVPFIYIRSKAEQYRLQGKTVAYTAIYAIIALLVFSPWMIRNVYWTGNPVYPLYNRFFSTNTAVQQNSVPDELKKEIKDRTGDWGHIAIRRIIFKESWAEIASIPIRIFFQGQDDNPKYFDGKLNPFLLFLPIFAFFPRRKNLPIGNFQRKLLVSFVMLFLMISFLRTSIRIRYILPVLPALIILSSTGLHNLVRMINNSFSPLLRRCGTVSVTTAMLLLFGINATYVVNQFRIVDPLNYLSGRIGREDYISRYRPEYPVMKYANIHLASSDKILGLYLGNRRYYCGREIIFGEDFLTRSTILASSAEDLSNVLTNRGFTHVLAHLDLVKQWVGTLNERERAIFVAFFNRQLHVLDKNTPYVLFEMSNCKDRNPI